MHNGPSLRVLLAEDSTLLAARLTELIRRLPDVELVGTVDSEACCARCHARVPLPLGARRSSS